MALETDLKQMIVADLKLADVKPESIDENAPLFGEGLGLDSLDAVELVMLLQKRFKIEIKDMEEARAAFASVKTLADFIRAREAAAQ